MIDRRRLASLATAAAVCSLTFAVLIFCTLVLLPRSSLALATTWYVDDDNCPGPGSGTLADPFCKIQDAVNAAASGDTISIAAGTYTEPGITATKNLLFQGAGVPTTIVQAAASQAGASDRVFYVTGTVQVTFTHMTVRHGNVTGDGGGLHVYGSANLEDVEVISNAASGNGGGVFVTTLQVSATNAVSNNAGGSGGGFYVTTDATIFNGSLIGNEAGADGGGAFGGGIVFITATKAQSNTATGSGGGLHVTGDTTMVNASLIGNVAGEYGGGLRAQGSAILTATRLLSNTAGGCGGARVGASLTVSGGEFSHNTAQSGDGGGACVAAGAQLQGVLLLDNHAGALSSGGGLYISSGNLTLSDTQLLSNTAWTGGGAAVYDGDAHLDGGLFQANLAGGSGGGLHVADVWVPPPDPVQGILYMSGTQFLSNTAQSTFAGHGGGAWVQNWANLDGGRFEHNTAGQSGGGLYLEWSSFALTATQFVSNSAGSHGGGAYAGGGSSVLAGGVFQDNWAATSGGGVFFGGSSSISDTRFVTNTAGAEGGAVLVVGSLVVNGGEFVKNTAQVNGGAVAAKSDAQLTGVSLRDNRAVWFGGGIHYPQGSLCLTGTQMLSNTAHSGGGVFSTSPMGVTGSTLSIEKCHFLGNSASGDGGAVDHTGASAIHNTLFARNAGAGNGEVLCIASWGTLDIVHCTIVSPTQGSGAAIYVVTGTVNITNTIIANYGTGIQVISGTVSEDHNLFYGTPFTTTGTSDATIANGPNTLIGDPAFVAPGSDDYHLSQFSAALDNALAGLASDDLDGNPRPAGLGYDRGCYEGVAELGADVEVTKSGDPPLAFPGDVLTYWITYTNGGPATASEVWISDTLAAGTTPGGQVSGPAGWSGPNISGQVVSWYTPTLDAGASGTFVFTATLSGAAISANWVLTNTAEITATLDTTPTNNLWQATSVVQGLQIGKSHFPEPVTAAWNFWYYIDVTNTASSPATNLIISDTLPPEVAPYSVQPDMGGVFDGVSTVVWIIPSLGPNTSVQVSIKARTYSYAGGRCMTNRAGADSDQAAPPVSASDVACVVAGPPVKPTATPTPTPTPTPVPGTVLPIQNGLGDDNPDTYIYRYAANANYYLEPVLKVGYKQTHAALLRFDLSAIPPGSTIAEAWLEVYAAGWSGPGADVTIGAYAISATVQISETTWNEAQSGSLWTFPGCGDTLFDRRETPEFTLTTSGPLKWYRFDLTSLVREWFGGAVANNGVLLRQDAYSLFSYFFASAEYPDGGVRPRLVVRYR